VRRERVLPALAVLTAVVLAACGAGAGPAPASPTPASGIEGRTQASPTCPVETQGSPCPARPISAALVVEDATTREVARFTSAADGSFRVALEPGAYTLAQPPGAHVPPTLKPVPVTVRAGQYTPVVLNFDTGIR
jgi:hypothetical protein